MPSPQIDAQNILKILQTNVVADNYSGAQALNAWGAHDFKGSEASDKYGLAWITFRVNATKHTGWVRVALRGEDIFTVSLEKFSNVSAEYTTISVANSNGKNLAATIDKLLESE